MRYAKKAVMVVVAGMVGVAAVASAGVMETITTIATSGGVIAAVVTAALLAIFKWIPNDKIQAFVGGIAWRAGAAMTLGLAKWKWSAPFWQKVVEPWFIDIVDNTVGTFTARFIEGLRSDNSNG